jgi:hypothetical protein
MIYPEDKWMQWTWDSPEWVAIRGTQEQKQSYGDSNRFRECIWLSTTQTDLVNSEATELPSLDAEHHFRFIQRSNISDWEERDKIRQDSMETRSETRIPTEPTVVQLVFGTIATGSTLECG